jgi:hypothetical protein
MGLALDMLVSQSATYSSCYDPNGMYTYSITPAFNLTPIAFSAHPTNPRNGKVTQINGEITALGITGNTFSLTLPEGARTLSIKADSNTEYEGIGNFATLTVGTFVDMDGAVQSDGSLLATRIAVEDTDIQNLSVLTGPVMQTNTAAPILFALGRAQQGYFSANHMAAVWMPYSDPSATFQISGQLGNLQSLPFVPSFNGTNVVDGQEVYVTTQVTSFSGGYPYIPATTVTLMPQTINGTVVASSTVGNFTDYRVSLSSYALFPALAVQQGQTTLLTNPGEVEVYVGSNTQMLNTMALAPGSTLRFYGLVFNDNGTLRMDCGQVNDGVTSSSQSSAANRLKAWDIQTVRGEGAGRMQPTITTVTRYR